MVEKLVEAELYERAKEAIKAGEYRRAMDLLANEPDDKTESLYLRAVCLRRLEQPDEALRLLAAALTLNPKHGRCHQERGHILREQGQPRAALSAYGRATQENPSLGASWRGQAEILLQQGRIDEANRLKPHMERLANMSRPLVYVLDILSQGFVAKAEQACRDYLKQHPLDTEGMRLLAEIAGKLNVLDEAEFLLESAVMFQPDSTSLKVDYIGILRKRQKLQEAHKYAFELFELDPSNIHFKSQYAVISMQLGQYNTALQLFDEVLAEIPGEPVTLTSKGHALKTIGRTDAAIECYQQACREGVVHGEAWQSLANLKTYRFTDAQIQHMERLLETYALRSSDKVYLLFALGKAYEDKDDLDRAFARYSEGNKIKRSESRYIAEHMTEEFAEQKHVFSRIQKRSGGCQAADPIFVVGMPRAGSTLLEQVLSSHSLVDGTQELPNILSAVHQLRTRNKSFDRLNYPRTIAELTAEELQKFGEDYIEGTRSYRGEAPYFIDKMPNNFRHIGLIKLILPKAKIIDARRHPLSCTFSCFKQLFAEGQEFSYSLEDLGHYYRDYVDLMNFWHQQFPGDILHVQYEDVVENLESQVERILDYCQLPFEETCVRYWETERAVKTPSSEQVRQPIFKSGTENWQKFEPYLEPLKTALGVTLTNYQGVTLR